MEGIVSIIKPPGITSHDVVGIVRRILHEKRVGHSGTLDPLAMGVLPIYVGKATRLIEFSEHERKTYVAECQLGIATDTEDSTGQILVDKTAELSAPTFAKLSRICEGFVGKNLQTPSQFSAIKVQGQRAYDLARKGISVEIPPREVEIYECSVVAYAFPWFTIRVTCSAGTYIRALLRDIGEQLEMPAMMTALARTEVGDFSMSTSMTLEELEKQGERALLPIDRAIRHLTVLPCTYEEYVALSQGKRLSLKDRHWEPGIYSLYYGEFFFGIGEVLADCIKSKKILFVPEV